MNCHPQIIVCLLTCLVWSTVPASDPKVTGTLYWGNGDSLDGQLQSAEGDTLVWKSPLFADPLSLNLAVLSAVRIPELEAAEPVAAADDGFRITLTNNNLLYGEIAKIDADTMTFNSRRHGTLVVRKNKIRSLQRNQNQGLIFLGPRGLEDWSQKSQTAALADGVSNWQEEDDGSLTTLKGESSISQKLKLPSRCEIEFVLTSSTIPDFVMTIGGNGSARPRLEMWGDSFVARAEKDFVELQVVADDLRKLHVFAFIDFEKSVMVVYSHTGNKLGELKANNWDKLGNSITLEAIDSDLTLKHLRVSEWDGTIPQALVEGQSRVHMQDGRVHYGSLTELSSDSSTLKIALAPAVNADADAGNSDGEAEATSDGDDIANDLEVKLADIRRVVMSTVEQPGNDLGKTIVAWRNGGFLSGTLNSMDQESITLTTDFSVDPIRSSLAGVRRIGLPNTDVADEEPDRLFFDGGSLRGNLTVEDHAEPIRWTPVGGRNATTLVSGGNARFQRGAEPEQLAIDSNQFPDVVYLHDGDVFPCRTESCDDKRIRIVSPVTEIRQLDVNLVKAMEFGNSQRSRHQGFNKDDWERLTGAIKYVDSAVSFSSSAAFGHPDVMTGDALSFRIKWQATCYGNITFCLFAEDLNSPVTATTVNLLLQPSQIVVSDRAPDQNGQRAFFGFNRGAPADDGAVQVKNRDAVVEMIARDGKVHVSINGDEAKVLDLNPDGAGSKGLVIGATITSVNSRNAQTLKNNVRGLVEIDDFLVRNVVGASVKQFIQEEARELALTVPRFRRDDPPTHVLLAPNGDLLRGRLNSVTEQEIIFDSRLETFRFPRTRVAALIWLSQDKDAPPAPVRAATAVQAKLDNGFMLTMTPDRMSGGELIGRSEQLGVCRIPAKAIRDLFLGSPESRQDTMSYVRWIRRDAPEPEWETPAGDEQSLATKMIGQVVADFELPTLSGGMFRLSDHADKVVVLDFWATWCGPCVAALPEYVEATSNFEQSDAIFVAVNLEESPERINEFLSRHDLAPTVALDRGSVIAKRFQVSGIPHSVVLGPGGVIKHVTVGYRPGVGARTQEHIENILANDADE